MIASKPNRYEEEDDFTAIVMTLNSRTSKLHNYNNYRAHHHVTCSKYTKPEYFGNMQINVTSLP